MQAEPPEASQGHPFVTPLWQVLQGLRGLEANGVGIWQSAAGIFL